MFVFNVEEVGSYLQFLLMRERGNYKRGQKVVRHTKKKKKTIIKGMGRQRNGIYILKNKEEVHA